MLPHLTGDLGLVNVKCLDLIMACASRQPRTQAQDCSAVCIGTHSYCGYNPHLFCTAVFFDGKKITKSSLALLLLSDLVDVGYA